MSLAFKVFKIDVQNDTHEINVNVEVVQVIKNVPNIEEAEVNEV